MGYELLQIRVVFGQAGDIIPVCFDKMDFQRPHSDDWSDDQMEWVDASGQSIREAVPVDMYGKPEMFQAYSVYVKLPEDWYGIQVIGFPSNQINCAAVDPRGHLEIEHADYTRLFDQ